jgi:hypothetical protein
MAAMCVLFGRAAIDKALMRGKHGLIPAYTEIKNMQRFQ